MEAAAAAAKRFAEGGYEAYVDGVIGPWFLEPWIRLAEADIDVRYVVLRPDERTTLTRALRRRQQAQFPMNGDAIAGIWRSLADLGCYEPHAVDTCGGYKRDECERMRSIPQKKA